MSSLHDNRVKFILVSGSVVSGVGKGVVTSSLGLLLRSKGYRISVIKVDPYLNIDAGTFSPHEHGEVFVLDDGGEVDLDFGNYERFLGLRFTRSNNITSGKVYNSVTDKERRGDYLGKTVQIVPHITDEIVNCVERVGRQPVDGSTEQPHVCIIELGGTIGDIESMIFAKAFGDHFSRPKERHRFMNVHVSMLIGTDAEPQKTKPMQQGILLVREYGLIPDLLIVRGASGIDHEIKKKIACFAHLEMDQVIDSPNVNNTFRVPKVLEKQDVLQTIIERLNLDLMVHVPDNSFSSKIENWESLIECMEKATEHLKIALVGKYVSNRDAYFSVDEALTHAGTYCNRKIIVERINAEDLADLRDQNKHRDAWMKLKECSGIVVPGGFGGRGIEGIILACEYARKHKIPFLGICLGMQCAVIEFARNVCQINGANSTEFCTDLSPKQQLIIEMLEHSASNQNMGASMRLGRRPTMFLTQNSVLRRLYSRIYNTEAIIEERHRHRFEVNPEFVRLLSQKGLHFVGMGADETTDESGDQTVKSSITAQLSDQNNNLGDESVDVFFQKIETLCKRHNADVPPIRMEIVELQGHPYFVGVQFHPEYLSSPFRPSPPFLGLILASTGKLGDYLDENFSNEFEKLTLGNV